MDSCCVGSPKIKISATNFSRLRYGNLLIPNNQRLRIGQSSTKYPGLRTTLQAVKAIQSSTVPPAESPEAITDVEDSEENKSPLVNTQLIPKSYEVEALVNEIADSSSIAEFELNLGGFRLYVAKELAVESSPPPQQILSVVAATPTPTPTPPEVVNNTNGSASSSSLSIAKTPTEKAADEGLVILKAPVVGFLKKSRVRKGKASPPVCEKDKVKEGRVLCYIQQFDRLSPVLSEVSGEVVEVFFDDGDPVGYGDPLYAVLPSFPGIKKLQ